ncbi:MAG: hypothetical protein HKN95_03255 [Acidimicrobiia bacterium]|nr:hypothetical protein [Acidimicrobiia bacterium]
MRHRTIRDWFVLVTFSVPLAAALSMFGLLGVLAISDLLGVVAIGRVVTPAFFAVMAAFLGLVVLFRVAVLVAAVVAGILLTMHRSARGAVLLVKTTVRGV